MVLHTSGTTVEREGTGVGVWNPIARHTRNGHPVLVGHAQHEVEHLKQQVAQLEARLRELSQQEQEIGNKQDNNSNSMLIKSNIDIKLLKEVPKWMKDVLCRMLCANSKDRVKLGEVRKIL